MTIPAPPTDREILDALKPLLTEAYEHSGDIPDLHAHPADRGWGTLPADLTRTIHRWIDAAHRAGITPRQIASHCRVPGHWVIRWITVPEERAAAYEAEIQHLEREAAMVRRNRARYARDLAAGDQDLLRSPANPQGKPLTKTVLAEKVFKTSRVTLDKWIAQAEEL